MMASPITVNVGGGRKGALTITCPKCGTVNTFTSEDRVRCSKCYRTIGKGSIRDKIKEAIFGGWSGFRDPTPRVSHHKRKWCAQHRRVHCVIHAKHKRGRRIA